MIYYLTAPDMAFTRANIAGGVTLTRSVNAGGNLTLGSCVANKIEFTLLDLTAELENINGKEFEYSTAAEIPYDFKDESLLIFQNGDRYYFAGSPKSQGLYCATKPERLDETKWKVVCYDRMNRFDRVVDDWFNSLVYPISLKNMLIGLCGECGVTLATNSFTNDGFMVQKNVIVSGQKGRELLSFICEVAGSFGRINTVGELELGFYQPSGVKITKTISSRISDYEVQKIDKLQVKAKEDDIGVIVGTGKNAYVIHSNPLLFASSDEQIRPVAENIFNKIKDLSYTPMEVDVFAADGECNIGDIISVTTRRGSYNTVVMSIVNKGIQNSIASVGDENRSKLTSVNRVLQQLKGRTNEIIATVDEFSVALTDVEAATSAQFLIQADLIAQKVAQTDYNGNVISSLINQTAGEILISATALDLAGYATFSSLSGADGTTVINGGNITTGTIDADTVNIVNLNADNITAGKISGDIIEGGTITGVNMNWGNGQVEMGAVDNGSQYYAYINADWKLKVDATSIELNATNVHIGEMPGTNYFDASGNDFSGTATFNYGLDVTGDYYLTAGNAAIGYLKISGKVIYMTSDGLVRWKDDPWG